MNTGRECNKTYANSVPAHNTKVLVFCNESSVLCSFSSLVIRNRHRVAMYFHAPCGVVLYFFVCKLYANKEKKSFNYLLGKSSLT